MRLCLDEASAANCCEIGYAQFNHFAESEHDDETLALMPSLFQASTSIAAPA